MVVRVVTLRVAILMHVDEVAIGHAIDAHLHDGLVAHADLYATIASGSMAVLASTARMFAFPAISCLPHTILVVIVVWLTARALRTQVLIQTNEAFLRALKLGLLVWLHRLLL